MEKDRSTVKYYVYSIETIGMTIVMLVIVCLTLLPIMFLRRDIIINAGLNPFFNIALILLFILHEIVHGISYRMSKGVSNSDITFGAKLEKVILFCVCKKPISKKDIIRSLLAPLFVLSFVPLIINFIFNLNNDLLITLAVANMIGAAGDLLMTRFILTMPEDTRFVEDSRNRFVLITSKDISKQKALGLKLDAIEENFDNIANTDSRKIIISKASYVIFGAICLYTILSIFQIV